MESVPPLILLDMHITVRDTLIATLVHSCHYSYYLHQSELHMHESGLHMYESELH